MKFFSFFLILLAFGLAQEASAKRGDLLVATEVEIEVTELPSSDARSFAYNLDYQRFFNDHPEARLELSEAALYELAPSRYGVLNWPAADRQALAQYLGWDSMNESNIAKIPSVKLLLYWTGLPKAKKLQLFSVVDLSPAQSISLLSDLLPRVHEIHLRADADPEWKKVAEWYEWEKDGDGVLEFRTREPAGRRSAALQLNLLNKVIPAGSIHMHASYEGESLRTPTVLMNMALGALWASEKSTYVKHSVSLGPVDTRGFVRLYDPDRIEVRVSEAKDFFENVRADPAATARAIVGKSGTDLVFLILNSAKSELKDRHLEAVSEGLAALERSCAGCLAANRNFLSRVRRLADRIKLSPGVAYLLAHISGFSPDLQEPIVAAVRQGLESEELRGALIRKYTRIAIPAIRERVLEKIEKLPLADRNFLLGSLNELDQPVYLELLKKTLGRLSRKTVTFDDASLFRSISGFPEDEVIRSRILSFLDSPDSKVRIAAATELLRVNRFLNDQQANHVLGALAKDWALPESAELRRRVALSNEPRWLIPILNRELKVPGRGTSTELRMAFRGPSRDLLQAELSRNISASGPARRNALELAAIIPEASLPGLLETTAEKMGEYNHEELQAALRVLKNRRGELSKEARFSLQKWAVAHLLSHPKEANAVTKIFFESQGIDIEACSLKSFLKNLIKKGGIS